MRDRLSDLEAEARPVRSDDASSRLERRPEKDERGRPFMSEPYIQRHKEALRVLRTFDRGADFDSDKCVYGHILATDAWFQQQGFRLAPDMTIEFENETEEEAFNLFFGQQAISLEHDGDGGAEYADEDEDDPLAPIGDEYRSWWYNEDATPNVGEMIDNIENLLKAHCVNI